MGGLGAAPQCGETDMCTPKHECTCVCIYTVVVVQLLSHIRLFETAWTAARQASLSFAISWSLLKLMSIESVMPSNLLLPPSIFPSIRAFSNESALHIRWPEYWSFSFSISPSNEYSGLISLDGLVGSPCSPRDSQKSAPTPQFKSINSLVLNFSLWSNSHIHT